MGAQATKDAFQQDMSLLGEGRLPAQALKAAGEAIAVSPFASAGPIPMFKDASRSALNFVRNPQTGALEPVTTILQQAVAPTGKAMSPLDTLLMNPTNPVMQYIKDVNDFRKVGLFYGSTPKLPQR